MISPALEVMRGGLTPAYGRGLETIDLRFGTAENDGTIPILPYEFRTYQNLYEGRLPESPRYLLAPTLTGSEQVVVRIWFKREQTVNEEPHVDVVVPAGWPANRALPIPISGRAVEIGNTLRLTRFRVLSPTRRDPASWMITGLLGNLAKLLWAVGWEYEELTLQLPDVASQRNAATAHGFSLDLLGSDLGVSRFPPRPYTWDSDTLALYHLDDVPQQGELEVAEVLDDRFRYDATFHHGKNSGGHSGRVGRFGAAFGFGEAPAFISVDDHAEFALPATSSFTVELLLKPDPGGVATGGVVAKRSVLNTAAAVGWALSVGSFRGFDHNLRFSLSDGVTEVEVFSDRNLADGVFHHVAAVVERRPETPATTLVRLYVDAIEVARQSVDGLGALTTPVPVQLGFGKESVANNLIDAQYFGVIDEVRLSRVARATFHPVLGEDDDQYRRRLRLFQRWTLPSPPDLQAALNEVAGPVAGDPAPFVIDEVVDPMVTGSLTIRVLPEELKASQCISADGDPGTTEARAAGTVEDEVDFDEAWLRRHEDAVGLDFGGIEANRRMQTSVKVTLDLLLARCSATLRVLRAYDSTASDLHRVGRALLLQHSSLGPSELAVLAHAAGFDFVCHTREGMVHVAQRRQDIFSITPPRIGDRAVPDVDEGKDLALGLEPDPNGFPGAEVSWSLARCGFGQATLTAKPPTLHAVRAGDIALHVEVRRRGHVRGGSRMVRIGLGDHLGIGESISGKGERGISEQRAVSPLDPVFQSAYLISRDDDLTGVHTNIDYGSDPSNRLMQRVTARVLDRLLERLKSLPGNLVVDNAYDPHGTGVATQGRELRLHHGNLNLSPAQLASHAFAAGFDFIRVEAGPPPGILVAVDSGELIAVSGPSEVRIGALQRPSLDVQPQAKPVSACFSPDGARLYVADSGNDLVTSFRVSATPANAFPTISIDQTMTVAKTPVAVAATGTRLYVVNVTSGTVAVLDATTLAPVTTVRNLPGPTAIATDGTRFYVACVQDRTVRSFDLQTSQPLSSLQFPDIPLSLACAGANTLYVILQGGQVVQVASATMLSVATLPTGTKPIGAAVTPDGTKLYVACAGDDAANHPGEVRVYSTASSQQTAAITGFPSGSAPAMVAFSADQKFAYVATLPLPSPVGRVHIADVNADTLLPEIFTVAGAARWVATSPPGTTYQHCLVVASDRAGTLTLADPAPLAPPPSRAPRVVLTLGLGSGMGEELAWSTVPFGRGRLELSSSGVPAVRGTSAGWALIRATYVNGRRLRPYQFALRLNPALASNTTVKIRKDQYDLLMNVLNAFHPIGVEVNTRDVRERVVELLTGDLLEVFPGYTFPDFRIRRSGSSTPIVARTRTSRGIG